MPVLGRSESFGLGKQWLPAVNYIYMCSEVVVVAWPLVWDTKKNCPSESCCETWNAAMKLEKMARCAQPRDLAISKGQHSFFSKFLR